MTKRDYYEILGISKGASEDEIKKAYRNLALQFHPDRVPEEKKKEAEERFKEISEAYAVLSAPDKRKLYDQYGHAGIDGRYSAEDIFRNADFSGFEDIFSGGGGFGGFSTGGGFDDLLSSLFGGGFGGRRSRRSGPSRGSDLEYRLAVSLEEAFGGCEKTVDLYNAHTCSSCRGTGAKPGTSKKTCPTCKGAGTVRYSRGFFSLQQTCSKCGGSGEIVGTPCPTCAGRGKVKKHSKITVKIPAGVDTGNTIRVRGKGEAGEKGGPTGDLYIVVKVSKHRIFQREGENIYVEVPIGFATAALGGEITVPTLNGNVSMKIPSGTSSNKTFRLKGKGMPFVNSSRTGDEYVTVFITPPTNLTTRQKELLREFAEISGEKIDEGIFKKIFGK
ncbi:MAG: molecular chaperone DnaJ [Elusimicrobia bacterium]|nr:molecular chaperone DnaJ [Elusimicrobiota bacterium]